MGRLNDQVVLVTGAGSGMGKVIAEMFVHEGARVALLDSRPDGLEETANQIRQGHGEDSALALHCDVTNEDDVKTAITTTVNHYGKLTVLYNNAGIMPEADHSVVDTDAQVWDAVQNVNLKGVYLVCKYGIPQLIAAGGGSVINIASFVALVGCSVPQDSYTASKGAVIALTKSLAAQFGAKGVRANAICPGPIETPLLMEWLLTDPEAKALRLARIPLGRFGKPEDVGHLAIYLASKESSWMTGAELSLDGGITSFYF